MTCSEEHVVAFLAGELTGDERSRLDEHLLGCAACWRAVQEDRAGRLALEQLREVAPPGLADRVRLAVELAGAADGSERASAGSGRAAGAPGRPVAAGRLRSSNRAPGVGTRRPVRRSIVVAVAAACVLLAGLSAGLATTLGSGPRATDPPVVSAIAAMATANGGAPGRLASTHRSEHLTVAGQPVVIGAYRVEGVLTVVALSSSPFAMPDSAHVMRGSSQSAWMASRNGVGLWCVNAPAGKRSMLVAARMPAVQLPAIVSRLPVASL